MQRRWIAGVVSRCVAHRCTLAGRADVAGGLTRTRGLIGVVCVVGVLAGGCTSQAAAPTSTNASSTSSLVPSSSSSGSDTSSPSATTTTASSKAASSTPTLMPPTTKSAAPTSNPWPASLKPAQVKDARAAINAYRAYYSTISAAYADPQRSWTAKITLLTAEPVRSQQLVALNATAGKGQRMTGKIGVDPTVTKVGTGDVYLRSCVDTSRTEFTAGGKLLKKLPDVKGSYWRHLQLDTVTKYADGTWRISALDEQNWSAKC